MAGGAAQPQPVEKKEKKEEESKGLPLQCCEHACHAGCISGFCVYVGVASLMRECQIAGLDHVSPN